MTASGPGRDDPTPDEEPPDDANSSGHRDEVDWDSWLAHLAEQPLDDGWVTLHDASEATGVARSTLRSWYRGGQLPSRMVPGIHGPQRLVPLDVVLDRALKSSRVRRQLEHARSLEADVDELRQRLEAIERHLGLS